MFAPRIPDWVERPGEQDPSGAVPHPLPLTAFDAEHLLKVAGAVTGDAQQVWTEVWNQLRARIPADGAVTTEMTRGFVPACGWAEFMEKLWLLKHHLDSASRVCRH